VAVAGAVLGCHLATAYGSNAAVDAAEAEGADVVEATEETVMDASELVAEAGDDVSDSLVDLF